MAHPFIPSPNAVSIAVQFLQAGQQTENVFHAYRPTTVWNEADMQTLADAVSTWVQSTYMPQLPNNTQYVGTRVQDINVEGGNSRYSVIGSGATGGSGGALSNAVSFAVHKITAGTGRSGAGRVFVTGVPANATTSPNTVSSAYGNDLCTTYRALRDAIPAAIADAFLSIVSLRNNNAWRIAGISYQVLDFVCKDLVLDTQRRRGVGRGR